MKSQASVIPTGSLGSAAKIWLEGKSFSQQFLLVDAAVWDLHADYLTPLTQSCSGVYVLPAGENSKQLSEAERCWQWLLEKGADRQSLILACGGGACTDFAGFVASTFQRGLSTLLLPTSLLAMIDASIGGKTALNFAGYKNYLGTFWPPAAVLVDPYFLNTLPEREYRSGLAELLKMGLIQDPELLRSFQNKQPLPQLIQQAILLKERIVEQDPFDQGIRELLNFGHSFAHAFEALIPASQLLHGEAVAIGMHYATELSHQLNLLSSEAASEVKSLLLKAKLPTQLPQVLGAETILAAMKKDKKNRSGQIRLVLLEEPGRARVMEGVAEAQVIRVLEHLNQEAFV